MQSDVSRRGFVSGGLMGAAVLGAAGSVAFAAEEESYTFADTVTWDAEYDVVVLGMGFAGLAAAMGAADAGANVLLVDKAPDGAAGGNSRVCGQLFLGSRGDVEAPTAYFKALAGDREIPDDIIEVMAQAVAFMPETISELYGFSLDDMTCWDGFPQIGNYSPEYPELPGSDNVSMYTAHMGAGDSYLFLGIKKCLAQYEGKIDVWYSSPATSLIQDPDTKTIVGVTIERNDAVRNVRALNGVCVCTGGFENNRQMLEDYLDMVASNPLGTLHNTGDGIRMCQEAGADLWHMSVWEGSTGLAGLGYVPPEGMSTTMISACVQGPMNTGACVLVGPCGNRFVNESYIPRHGHVWTGNGLWENPMYPNSVYAIYDKTQMDLIIEEGALAAQFDDTVLEFATLAEVADFIGCEADALQKTIDNFALFIEMGEDFEEGRDVALMREFDGEAYYVLPLAPAIINTQGGPRRDAQARVVGIDGEPIPHLYSAGECGGITVFMYQGGTNVTECLTFGRMAGANAAAPKDPLPPYTAAPAVVSTPATIGESDYVAE